MGKSRKFKKIVKAKAMANKVENALEEILDMMPVSRYSSELLRIFETMEQVCETSEKAVQMLEEIYFPKIREIGEVVYKKHGKETLQKIRIVVNGVSPYGVHLDGCWYGIGGEYF